MVILKESVQQIKESYNWNEIFKRMSVETPADDMLFMIGNVFNYKYVEKIDKLLGTERNKEGYILSGKEGINYSEATDSVKKSIINLIKQDALERP